MTGPRVIPVCGKCANAFVAQHHTVDITGFDTPCAWCRDDGIDVPAVLLVDRRVLGLPPNP